MPIFSYQSFNAASTNKHVLTALTPQKETKSTDQELAKSSKLERLVYPTLHDANFDAKNYPNGLPADRHARPVQGPANLVATAPEGTISDDTNHQVFFEMMKSKVLQNRQAVYREMKDMPHVTAFGELDSKAPQSKIMEQYVVGSMKDASINDSACQSFSVYCSNGLKADCVGQGEGWYAIRYLGLTVVFVHVPNRLMRSKKTSSKNQAAQGPVKGVAAQHKVKAPATKPYTTPANGETTEDRLVKFYQAIADAILQKGGGPIDLIMGDTNQSSGGVTPKVLGKATGLPFENAHVGKIKPIDAYNVGVGGTNAKGDKMYDVAVYNSDTVKMKKIRYWSQLAPWENGSSVAAVTDHMGLAIEVEKI